MLKKLILLILVLNTLMGQAQLPEPQVDSIPMRDGKKLAADIYLPENGMQEHPVILVQTPYNRLFYRVLGLPLVGFDLENSDYAFVIADWRCFYGSAAACIPNPKRGEDGYDAVEWIAGQEWSNGKIGTWGLSALGRVQYLTAREQPPHLLCAAPLVAAPQYNYLEYFPGGVIRTEYVEQLDQLGFGLSLFLYNNVIYNLAWEFTEENTWYPDEIEIPLFMTAGWFDHNIEVMLDFFEGLQNESPIDAHQLLIGPWTHSGIDKEEQGELLFEDAVGWSDSLCLMFFNYYLLNEQNGWESREAIQYYETTENNWATSAAWPPEGTDTMRFYLGENGQLTETPPEVNNLSQSFSSDPRNPSPTNGGPTLRADLLQGPYDQSLAVENRDDLLIFDTEVLTETLQIRGAPRCTLNISSDRKDTDFAIRMTDVFPDGRSILILDGIRRMRFREGYTAEDTMLMQPGTVYRAVIELPPIAYAIQTGHKLRIDISSANYPRFDVNLNNGGAMYHAGDSLVTVNTVHFGQNHPSWISIPVSGETAGMTKEKASGELQVFPNPCNEWLTIIHPKGDEIKSIYLLDLSGRKVLQRDLPAGKLNHVLNLSNFKNGCFILKAISNERLYALPIIKTRTK